jgi:hypothetical protein
MHFNLVLNLNYYYFFFFLKKNVKNKLIFNSNIKNIIFNYYFKIITFVLMKLLVQKNIYIYIII